MCDVLITEKHSGFFTEILNENSIPNAPDYSDKGILEMNLPLFPRYTNPDVLVVFRDLYNIGLINITPDSLMHYVNL